MSKGLIGTVAEKLKEVFDLGKSEKMIVAVTLRGKQPMMIASRLLKTGKIIMLKPEPLPTDGVQLQEVLIPLMKKYTDGIKSDVLIDDHSDLFCRAVPGATFCPYDVPREMKRNGDKIAPIVTALVIYQQLHDRRLLELPTTGGNFHLPPSLVNTKFNGAGELVHEINRDAIRAEHILTIMTIIGSIEPTNDLHHLLAMHQENDRLNAEAVARARAGGGIPLEQRGEYIRGMNAITHADRVAAEKAQPSLAGTKISENEWIL